MNMATPTSKLENFKLEPQFGIGYVENSTYEWKYSTRQATGLKRWEKVRMIGAGGFGSVWLQKEKATGQLRAVKIIQRHIVKSTGLSQELAALITLTDVCTPTSSSPTHGQFDSGRMCPLCSFPFWDFEKIDQLIQFFDGL